MTDTTTTQDDGLGPKPEPATEAPELFPGGIDAVDDPERYHEMDPAVRDLDPGQNPAVEDEAPDEISEPDDKQQEPDEDSGTATDEGAHTEQPA